MTIKFLSIQLNNVASTASKLGRAEEAVAALGRRLEVLDRRARDNPDLPGAAADMILSYYAVVAHLKELGRLDDAARVVRQGRDRAAEVSTDEGPFFMALSSFYMEARAVAEARAKDSALARPDVESAAAAAVATMRNYILTGWRDSRWMKTNPAAAPLKERTDFRELIARVEALMKAEQVAKNAQSSPAEKLIARQECLAVLETLAAPESTARHVRRALAQARQDLAQALLDAGRALDARLAFDEALALRQSLVEESPSSEQLLADLAESQSAVGDLFAAAGKLTDAKRSWEKAVATLDDGLKKNPNSIPSRTARAARLTHITDQYGQLGLWDLALKHDRLAFGGQPPARFDTWYEFGVLLAAAGRSSELQSLASRAVVPLRLEKADREFLHLSRIFLLSPEIASSHPEALRQVIERVKYNERDWPSWCQGFAHVRLGQAAKGLPLLEKVKEPVQKLPALAIALLQLGKAQAAREALEQADAAADALLRDSLAADVLRIPDPWWQDWLLFRVLRREAHQAIHGKPMPESPYDRLFQGRLLFALNEPQQAEAEFTGAAELRPGDLDLWLTRARIFAKLGLKDRATADLARAQQKADDPRPSIETGRLLAELGERTQADAAFARASALAKGELNRFLESGWWVAGPFPVDLDLRCPPEVEADPSKSVPAVGRTGNLKWQAVSTEPANGDINFGTLFASLDKSSFSAGDINFGTALAGNGKSSFYAMAYVDADRDRTASLYLSTRVDKRLWVNGQLVFAGRGGSKPEGTLEASIPIVLRAGRNQLLMKTSGDAWCQFQFDDAPGRRAYALEDLGLWAEAADQFAEADRRGPLEPFRAMQWIRCLLASGRNDEARRVFAEAALRHDQTTNETARDHLGWACPLPPEKGPDRDQRVALERKLMDQENDSQKHFWLGHAFYRAARFDEAEKSLRRAISLEDKVCFHPLLAATLHYLGRADEARKVLQAAEERSAKLVKDALTASHFRTPQPAFDELLFRSTLPEARTLIRGKDSGATADEAAFLRRARERRAELDKADDFARLTELQPGQPRLWIDRGRRLGQLKRWDEAATVFARAIELAPADAQVWQERGRAYADLGKWSEAAADLCKAINLTAEPSLGPPYYPWDAGRGQADELIAGSTELFERVTKMRPKDATISARRVEHFAAAGRWPETAAALKGHLARFPDDWWASCLLAKLLLSKGDLYGHRDICRSTLERFAGTTDYYVPINIARAALLAPADFQSDPLVGKLLDQADKQVELEFWLQATAALAECRWGDSTAALKRLDARVIPHPRFSNQQAMADAIRALACETAGRKADARAALNRARAVLARDRPRPDRGWNFNWDWHNWIQIDILLRETESRIPTDMAVAASPAQDENARHDRQTRADRLSTDFALALIQVDVGARTEAEVELRAVLAARVKIAAEEPSNRDFLADLLAARTGLGRFLADAGRSGEAEKELTEAIAIGKKLVEQSTDRRIRLDLAAASRALGDLAWNANRPAEAIRALRSAVDLLDGVQKEDPINAQLATQIAAAEYDLGAWCARHGLLQEAAAVMRVDDWPRTVDRWRRIRAGQLRQITGNPSSMAKVADSAYLVPGREESATSTSWMRASIAVAHIMAPGPADDPGYLLALAKNAAEGAPATDGRHALVGAWEFRSGRYDDAIRRLDTPGLRENPWAKAFLAMAFHKLHQTDRAREWLTRLADHLTNHLRTQLAAGGPRGNPDWEGFLDGLCLYQQAHQLITGKSPAPLPLLELHRAVGYDWTGEPSKADAAFKVAIDSGPDDPAVWLARGRALAAAGHAQQAADDFARAESLASRAVAAQPASLAGQNLSPRALLGLIQLERGNARAAATTLGQGPAGTPARPADELLVLALAHGRLGEMDQARKDYCQAVAAAKPAGANALLRDLVLAALRDDLMRAALRESAASAASDDEDMLAAALGELPEALGDAIRRQPNQPDGYLARADWYGRRGLWRKAADDLAQAYRLGSNRYNAFRRGILLARTGEVDRYRDLSRQLLDQFAGTSNSFEADNTLKTFCLLGPDQLGGLASLKRLAEVAVSGDPAGPWYEWFVLGKALYEYRAGQFDAAVASCRACRKRGAAGNGDVDALAVTSLSIEAMARGRSGNPTGARGLLAEAMKLIDEKLLPQNGADFGEWWHDRLAALILYREAETLLQSEKNGPKK